MNTKKQTKNSNINIVNFVMILGVFVVLTMGCQQINDAVNSNATTNTNTAANSNANANANSNANSNTTANSNANANTSVGSSNSADNTNALASNSAANTATVTKNGVPLTQEEKVFANSLLGSWSSDSEKVVFTKDEIKFFNKDNSAPAFLTWKYAIVDEKNVEITDENGQKSTATMTFENKNTTLRWKDKMGDFIYQRETDKP